MKKVLIVDDSAVWRNFLQNLLESKGHSVEIARDGLDGINKFFTFLPDVVIVDYVMPKLNGIHLTRFIRSYRASKNVGILMLTGAEETVNPFWAKKSGVDLFLKKTLSQEELESQILEFVKKPFSIEWSREIYKIHMEPYGELVDIIEQNLKESTLVREINSYAAYAYDEKLVLKKLHSLFKDLFEFSNIYIGVSSQSDIRLYGFGLNLAKPEVIHSLLSNTTGIKHYTEIESYYNGNKELIETFIIEVIYNKELPEGFILIENPQALELVSEILSVVNEPLGILFKLLNDYRNLSTGKEIDKITGLYNETFIRAKILSAMDFSRRNKLPLTFSKIKIKNLDQMFSEKGYEITNKVLKIVGNILNKKYHDLAGRISTNEFICIHIGSEKEKVEIEKDEYTKKILEEVRKVENIVITIECSIIEWNGETVGEILEEL